MRWLACQPGPQWSVKDLHDGWVEALRGQGEKVLDYPLGDWLTFFGEALLQRSEHEFYRALSNEQAIEASVDRLAAALWKTRPDVLLITSGFFLPAPMLEQVRRDGTKVVFLATEQPYELGRELEIARHSDVTLLNDPAPLATFRDACPVVRYQPHCYRPALHKPGPARPELECDVGFVGTGYPSRVEFLEKVDLKGLDVLLAGNWKTLEDTSSPLRAYVLGGLEDCLDNAKTVDVYRATRVGLNLYRREAERPELSDGWAIGPREVEMAACEAFFLRDPRPEGDILFPFLPTFTTPDEVSELIRWYLAHPSERASAAQQARAAVADRTFDNAAAGLLRLLHEG